MDARQTKEASSCYRSCDLQYDTHIYISFGTRIRGENVITTAMFVFVVAVLLCLQASGHRPFSISYLAGGEQQTGAVPPPLPFDHKRPQSPPLIYPPAYYPMVLPPGVRTTTAKPPPPIIEDSWNMTDSNGTRCIMLTGQFTFNIPYITTEHVYKQANVTVPKDAKVTKNSRCRTNDGNQLVELEFGGNVAAFEFVKKNNRTSLQKLSLNYTMDTVRFPDAAHVGQKRSIVANDVDAFSAAAGHSFNCPAKTTSVTMSDGVSMLASNVRLDAFRQLASGIFSHPSTCSDGLSSLNSLPITVGSLVAGSVPAGTCLFKFFKNRKGKKPKEDG